MYIKKHTQEHNIIYRRELSYIVCTKILSMDRTKENNKGITMISLVIVIAVLGIIAVVTITTIRKQDIIQRTKNAVNEYNGMVENQYNEMEGNKVLEILDF